MIAGLDDTIIIGKNLKEKRGMLNLSYPIEHGVINDWESMIEIWNHAIDYELQVESDSTPVLIS